MSIQRLYTSTISPSRIWGNRIVQPGFSDSWLALAHNADSSLPLACESGRPDQTSVHRSESHRRHIRRLPSSDFQRRPCPGSILGLFNPFKRVRLAKTSLIFQSQTHRSPGSSWESQRIPRSNLRCETVHFKCKIK